MDENENMCIFSCNLTRNYYTAFRCEFFFEFLFYHFLYYFLLGPFTNVILCKKPGIILCRNLLFWGLKSKG